MPTPCVRFIVPAQIHDAAQVPVGVVQVAYQQLQAAALTVEAAGRMKGLLDWLSLNLAEPERFNRTRSKGYYRRETRGICWIKVDATQHVATLRRICDELRALGIEVRELRATRLGYVVYEDEHQIVAEPFRDTPTR